VSGANGNRSGDPGAMVRVGIDVGGTFTDLMLVDDARGQVTVHKVPSSPADPSLATMTGLRELCELADVGISAIDQLLHGTTVATNIVLERNGSRTGMITTRGFRDLIYIGRHRRPKTFSIYQDLPWREPTLVERRLRLPVSERIVPPGEVRTALDEDEVRDAVRRLRDEGVEAVCVCFLFSFLNPAHEDRVKEILEDEFPEAHLSISHEVTPQHREYERFATAALNAYIGPKTSRYLRRMNESLHEIAPGSDFHLMASNGGTLTVDGAAERPTQLLMSGPVAGIIGGIAVGRSAGFDSVITLDVGGTSADIGVAPGGQLRMKHLYDTNLGGYDVMVSMADLDTIGAGGGSIARVSDTGALIVGPQSAGAVPGPVCYGRGGVEPTVTDAHLALGHLPPYLLGGSFALDVEAARVAIRRRVAEPLGMTVEAAARGILAIVDNNMVGAIRVVSVERGHDPRDFSLLPFGGAGPLHGGSLARLLGMRTIVVPPGPGVLSALGLLVSNLKAEFTRTCLQKAGAFDAGAVARVFGELDTEARAWLDAEDVPAEARRIAWHASLRYQHQGFELFVPWAGRDVTEASAAATVAAFHRLHERLYTFAQEDTPVEIVTLRVDARGAFPAPALRELPPTGPLEAARVGAQKVFLETGPVEAAIYARERLGIGARIDGPAILTQLDATTLLLPDQFGVVDRFGNLIVEECA
jgi:N-methylhydantoinase A